MPELVWNSHSNAKIISELSCLVRFPFSFTLDDKLLLGKSCVIILESTCKVRLENVTEGLCLIGHLSMFINVTYICLS